MLAADCIAVLVAVIMVAGFPTDKSRASSPRASHWPRIVTGLALALPEAVMARPTGFNRADDIYIRIPVEGAGDWLTTSESA